MLIDGVKNKIRDMADARYAKEYERVLASFHDYANALVREEEPGEQDVELLLKHVLEFLEKRNYADSADFLLRQCLGKDLDTFTHGVNTSMLCYHLAKWLDFSEKNVEKAALAGLLHDIGKLKVPGDILKKPAPLTSAERKEMEKHSVLGYNIMMEADMNYAVCIAALQHHERCDGTGYPYGLMGSQINEFAKIVAIADVYEAMTAARVYHKPMPPEKALAVLEKDAARYDRWYIKVFIENASKLLGLTKKCG